MSDEGTQTKHRGPFKARLKRQTVLTASGWEVSFDCDEEVTVTPLEPVLDARAEEEGRPARFGWDPDAYSDLRRQCESAGEELPQEVIRGFERLREPRKIQVFAAREADGRIKVSFETRPRDNVPQGIVEDVARLVELLMHLQRHRIYSLEAKARLRQLLRERFPTLPQIKESLLLEAGFQVLREPQAWQEGMPPEERARYLATAAYHAIQDQPVHDEPDPDFEIEPPRVDAQTEDPEASPEVILYRREIAAKARALNLREGERRILDLILAGKASTWSEARDMVGLPDSYRVGLLKKLKTLAG